MLEDPFTKCPGCGKRAVKIDICSECGKCINCQLQGWPNSKCAGCEKKWNAITIDTLGVAK